MRQVAATDKILPHRCFAKTIARRESDIAKIKNVFWGIRTGELDTEIFLDRRETVAFEVLEEFVGVALPRLQPMRSKLR
jgi:hypothetical protein